MPRQSRLPHLLPLALLLALCAAPLAAQAGPAYTVAPVTAIGTDGGRPFGINNSGQVVGYTYNAGHTNAYVGTGGTATNLHPASPNVANSQAHGINQGGTVVGEVSYQNGPTRAAVFSNGSVQTLGTLGGQNSTANGINAGGQVVGTADLGGGNYHAFATQAGGGLRDLGTLGTGANSEGLAINDLGAMTGYSEIDQDGNYRAFLYANGSMQALATLGGNYAEGTAINNSGMVAGESFLAGDTVSHAFLYANGILLDLGSFGGTESDATGINEAGDVVGTANDAQGNWHAFLYSGGQFQDLNSLIDASLGWNITYAGDINDKGQIAARGCKAGNQCADLLLTLADTGGGGDPSPVSEPEAITAALAGLILTVLLRRRQHQR
jgi:probable HAF family extracellular repeat protein